MYHSILAASFIISVLFILYRNRTFFLLLLPPSLVSRLPPSLQPAPSSSLPFSSAPPSSSSSSLFSRLFNHIPGSRRYTPLPAFDWSSQASAGLTSTLFDINANIENSDSRTGLDPSGAQDIQTIMQTQGVGFDQARLIRHQQILVQNNIDPQTGLPLDRKAVTSLGGRLPGGSRD